MEVESEALDQTIHKVKEKKVWFCFWCSGGRSKGGVWYLRYLTTILKNALASGMAGSGTVGTNQA
jgi:hypothetical protein